MELPTNLKYQFKYTLIADYMFRLFKDNSCGHDFWHVYRTCETAHALAVTEHLDWRAMGRIEILALIHDVFDEKIVYRIPVDSVYRDLERKMYPYMKSLNTSFEELKASATSLRWSNDGSLASIEEKIVMDADRLDAIGAIGIIRAAAYGGAKKMHMYDAKSPEIDYSSGTTSASTISHFFDKLQHIRSRMFTDTGKGIAEHRHAFMMDAFMPEFMFEVHQQTE